MYYYEVTKNAILESKIDGKFYLVDFRKNVTDPNEYNWYFTVRQIMSNISREEILTCNIEDLPLSEKRIKLSDHQTLCFDMVRSVFPKLEGHYYAKDGKLMKDGQIVPNWIEFSTQYKVLQEKLNEEKYSDYKCYKVLGVTDISVVILCGFDEGRRIIYGFHPYADEPYFEMEIGIDVYGSCLYSDQKYLCITNERSHLYDEHYWMWPEISDIDNFDDSIPDVTDIMVLNSRGDEVYTATYYYCFGKPYFSEGCFVVYQDNDDKNLYRVFSYKNGYPRLTEIHVTGKIMTLAVDLDNNAIFIRSEESLFYIPADYRKELCLDSPTPELRKILKQLIGYDHVYGSKYSTECCERHYMLHITNDKYEQKTFHVRSENPDIYSLC